MSPKGRGLAEIYSDLRRNRLVPERKRSHLLPNFKVNVREKDNPKKFLTQPTETLVSLINEILKGCHLNARSQENTINFSYAFRGVPISFTFSSSRRHLSAKQYSKGEDPDLQTWTGDAFVYPD